MARYFQWSALPTGRLREVGIKSFPGGAQTGRSIAALKVLLGIALLADFKSRKIQTSLSDLEALTGLSRPMVIRGTEFLEDEGFIAVKRAHTNEYELLCPENDPYWAKLPTDLLRKNLSELPNRGMAVLAALKTYVLLISLRPNTSNEIAVTHKRIREETGIQPLHVRRALDVLFNHALISVSLSNGDGHEKKWRHNSFTLLGISIEKTGGKE